MIKKLKSKTRLQLRAMNEERKAKIEMRSGFTLLELLLVIAIIATLAGLIFFALNPADRIQEANEVKVLANSKDIEKALGSYLVDNSGTFPSSFGTLTYGYHDICKTTASGCVSLLDLVPNYLPSLPEDINSATLGFTGFKLMYNPVKNTAEVFTASEYSQWRESVGDTLSDGLVGYWKMDEASWNGTAGEVKDASGSLMHGTSYNSALVSSLNKYGNSGVFDGINDYVSVPGGSSLFSGKSAISVSFWVRPLSTNPLKSIINIPTSSGVAFSIENNSAASPARIYFNNNNPVDISLTQNVWSNIVAVFENGSVRGYKDGVLVGTTNNTAAVITSISGSLDFAKMNWTGGYSNINLDDVRIYNRALSTTEVKALYDLAPGPMAYWKFNETSGTTASDSSGNGYSGTLTSGPVWAMGKYNNGLQLDGIDDYIPITINVPETNYTYSTWFKTTDTGGAILAVVNPVAPSATSFDRQFGISNNGRFCHRVWSDETYCSTNAVNDNRWHYAAVTVGSGGGRIYLDGVQVAIGAKTTSDFSTDQGIIIGNHYWGSWGPYAGIIDDLKIYNYVRTPAQILWEYNQGM